MATIYGPVDTNVPDGYTIPPNDYYVGALPSTTAITFRASGGIQSSAAVDDQFDIIVKGTGGTLSNVNTHFAALNTGWSQTYNLTAADTITLEVQGGGGSGTNRGGTIFGLQVDTGVPAGYCAYGTQQQTHTTKGTIISTGLIDVMLLAVGAPAWLAIVFDTFVGTVIFGGDLCSGPPPTFPVFTSDDYLGSVPNVFDARSRAKWWTGLLAVAWPYFCECKPATGGGSAPIPYPPFAPVQPTGSPDAPIVLNCDGVDLCTQLNALARQILAMNGQLVAIRNQVDLVQRQHVPFATLHGALHAGLTGAGTIAVQGLIGLSVAVTAAPAYLGADMETPPETFKFGDVTVGTADGYLRKTWLVKNPQLFFPIEGNVTVVAYDLRGGVTINLQELVREP